MAAGLDEQYTRSLVFSWTGRRELDTIMQVWNQKCTNTCWEHATTDSLAAVDFICDGPPCTRLSVQELMNHAHKEFGEPNMADPNYIAPEDGVLLTIASAFQYAIHYGIPSARHCPFVRRVQQIPFDQRPQGVPRVYLNGFDAIVADTKMTCTRMICIKIRGMIEHAPCPAIVLACQSFNDIEDEIDLGPKLDEEIDALDDPDEVSFHSILLVGHGVENGIPYLLCKNSYGKNWGVNGFGKLAFGAILEIYCPKSTYRGY